MADTMHAFLNERLRLALSGHIPGHQLDGLVASLSHLFKTVRPDLTPAAVLIAVSPPSLCGSQYCTCAAADSILHMYKVTVFVDRKERGRCVAKVWVRGCSKEGYGEAVEEVVKRCGELVEEKEREREEKDKKEKVEEEERRRRKVARERFERGGGSPGVKGRVGGFEVRRGRERGFTVPSMGVWYGGL